MVPYNYRNSKAPGVLVLHWDAVRNDRTSANG